MDKNVGLIDRIIRFVIAAALVVAGIVLAPQGLWWIALIAIVPLVTGLVSFCPVWRLLGIKTIKVKKL